MEPIDENLIGEEIDCSKSKITVIDDPSELSTLEILESKKTGTKDMLKSKWKEITGK